MTVIAIIGVLAAVIGTNVSSARRQARDARRLADLQSIQTAVELYANEFGLPPADTAGSKSTDTQGGMPWIEGLDAYLSSVPRDPLPQSADHYYFYRTGTSQFAPSYIVEAVLEGVGAGTLTPGQNFDATNPANDDYYRTGSYQAADGKLHHRVSSGPGAAAGQ